jgi:hypothetical protein
LLNDYGLEAILLVKISIHILLHGFSNLLILIMSHFLKVNIRDEVSKLFETICLTHFSFGLLKLTSNEILEVLSLAFFDGGHWDVVGAVDSAWQLSQLATDEDEVGDAGGGRALGAHREPRALPDWAVFGLGDDFGDEALAVLAWALETGRPLVLVVEAEADAVELQLRHFVELVGVQLLGAVEEEDGAVVTAESDVLQLRLLLGRLLTIIHAYDVPTATKIPQGPRWRGKLLLAALLNFLRFGIIALVKIQKANAAISVVFILPSFHQAAVLLVLKQ